MPEPVRPTVLSLGQLLEKPPTAAPALVEPGLLPTQGILFVGGEPKVGKSLLVANLALALAAGEDRLGFTIRSEEHTSELQSLTNLVCRLLLEKKKKNKRE